MKTYRVLLLLLAIFSTPLVARAQDSRAIARKVLPSVVFIITTDTNDQPLAEGSGFFIRSGLIATNWHVVSDASKIKFSLMGQSSWYGAVVQSKDDARDVAVLKIVDDVRVPSLPLGDGSAVEVGEKIYAVGNPKGFEGTFSEGLVSGIRVLDGMRKIQFTAPISSGSSGGPLVNERGEVVGITSEILTTAQNLNFAVPVGYIKPLLCDPDAQKRYEEGIQKDYFYASRNNHLLIDNVRNLIKSGVINETPDGITHWHSRYDPFDPGSQDLYERAVALGTTAHDTEMIALVKELIRRHMIHRVSQKPVKPRGK